MIIGLSGYARSGKDATAAAFLAAHPEYRRVAFADKLYEAALKTDPQLEHEEGPGVAYPHLKALYAHYYEDWAAIKASPYGPALRVFLQNLGLAMRETVGPDVWVDAALPPTVADPLFSPEHRNLVITDVRFKNEAARIRNLNGIVVRVTRSGVEAANDHVSEHDLDDWPFDGEIHNNATPERAGMMLAWILNNRFPKPPSL